MIAVDTSSLIAFLAGDEGSDVTALDQALALNFAWIIVSDMPVRTPNDLFLSCSHSQPSRSSMRLG